MTIESAAQRWAFSTELSQERLRQVLDYNSIDGWFYWKIALSKSTIVGLHAGSIKNGYIYIGLDGNVYPAHVLAWFWVYNEWTMVDHEDRCRHHNWISNLRKSTYQSNAANRSLQYNNSGKKGVYERNGKYEVGIKVNQVRIYLGCFETLEEASKAYENAAKNYFGEFANIT